MGSEEAQGTQLLLWIFHATDKEGHGVFHHTYALTEIQARQQEQAWMAEQVNLGYENIEVKHYPGGFMQSLPGSIDADEVSR